MCIRDRQTPGLVVFDLLTETFDMYVDRSGISDVFISPNMIQQLFPGEDLIRRGGQKIQQLQFLGRHIHRLSLIHI